MHVQKLTIITHSKPSAAQKVTARPWWVARWPSFRVLGQRETVSKIGRQTMPEEQHQAALWPRHMHTHMLHMQIRIKPIGLLEICFYR